MKNSDAHSLLEEKIRMALIWDAFNMQVHRTMRNIFWAVYAGRKSAKSITIAYRNGQLQAFDRNMVTNETFYIFTDPSVGAPLGGVSVIGASPAPSPATDAPAPVTMWPDIPLENGNITWYKEPINPYTGKASSPINITPINITSYDLSKNIDYVLALKSTEVSWRLVVTESDDTPLLSSATPVRYRDSGIVVAVTGVTAALSSISQFLRELTSSHSGYLYLTTADGQLLATSTNASLIDSSGPRRTLVLANESSDPVIKAGAQWLYARHGFEGLVKTVVHAENVVLEGKRYYIDTFSLSLSGLQMVMHLALTIFLAAIFLLLFLLFTLAHLLAV